MTVEDNHTVIAAARQFLSVGLVRYCHEERSKSGSESRNERSELRNGGMRVAKLPEKNREELLAPFSMFSNRTWQVLVSTHLEDVNADDIDTNELRLLSPFLEP